MKRKYSDFTIKEAMKLIPAEVFIPWKINCSPKQPSPTILENIRRLEGFDLTASEQAKALWIDTVFSEIVADYDALKVWKSTLLTTDTLTGIADYLLAPRRAYLETPLLCVAEAKKDDFEKGAAQCVAEMVAAQWTNRNEKYELDTYGIVSNGTAWQFYRLTTGGEVFQTSEFITAYLPELLGALDFVCGECAKNAP